MRFSPVMKVTVKKWKYIYNKLVKIYEMVYKHNNFWLLICRDRSKTLFVIKGAQLRAQHKPELEEQMPPRPSHTAILPPGEETGSLECECYPDPAYDRQMKQLPLLSEFVTNNAANRGISHDIPPQIASSNMTFNRLTTQAQFAFGQAYEVMFTNHFFETQLLLNI